MAHAGMTALAALSLCASCACITSTAFARDQFSAPSGGLSLQDYDRAIATQSFTGWYVRADMAGTQERAPHVSSADASLLPAIQSSRGWLGSVGMGYQFTPWFRTDASVEFRNTRRTGHTSAVFNCITGTEGVTDEVTGKNIGMRALYARCYSKGDADLKRLSALFNGYIDLGAWGGVTPYVGAGAGVTRGAFSARSSWYTTNDGSEYAPEITPPVGFPPIFVGPAPPSDFSLGKQSKRMSVSNSTINFTWALMAGVAYDIGANSKLDIGYRFLNHGTFAPGSADRDSTVHEVRIGFRYTVD